MRTYTEFPTLADAMNHRRAHGTGGWIFQDESNGQAILFPPDMPPIAIFNHAMTRGKSGRLVGHA